MSKIVSFAIPCYNSAGYMDHCVQSILDGADGAEDIEIIYVAGSSNPMSVSSVVAATGERVRAQGYVAYSASPSGSEEMRSLVRFWR